jgi:hypothetical protein
MKNNLPVLVMALLMVSLSSCEAVEAIFKVGVWSGILIVVVIIAIILWLVSRFRR